MKKLITVIFTAILLVCISPIIASAEEALKAPTVQYKLINHDEIALRWTEVEGTDGYCVYRTDVKTGKTVKYEEIITDTAFNATGLEQGTDYIFKVAAVSENDGQITVGKKSRGTALTTPDEWYYYFESTDDSYLDTDDLESAVMVRKHYDNTGSEVFNMVHINKEVLNEASGIYENTISYTYPINIDGYVYFEFCYPWTEHDSSTYLCRMKNDGSNFEIVTGLSENFNDRYHILTDHKNGVQYIYQIDNETAYSFCGDAYEHDYVLACFDNYIETPPDGYYDLYDWDIHEEIKEGLTSEIHLNYYDRDNKSHEIDRLYEENNVSFSGFAEDDKYIYFLSEPLYNITDKTDTIVYRANYDGSDLQEINTIPKDNSFIYGAPNDGSIVLLDCDGDYLYYYIFKLKTKAGDGNWNGYYTFYRIGINDKKAVPQEIITVDYLPTMSRIELCNGYLYIETCIWDNNGEYVPIYIRIRADGKGLKKQVTPFEWRY